MDDNRILTLFELNSLVRETLSLTMGDDYWIQAELSEVHPNANGHCYVEFVQKDDRHNSLSAKAKGIIWRDQWMMIKSYFEQMTGQSFASGIKVQVLVTVSFHEIYGYSLIIHDINPEYTLGDMARRRKEILKQIEADGILTMNKELPFPLSVQRIAVISSATAAGYGDFCRQLNDNASGLVFYVHLFQAAMQGTQVEESVLAALDDINTHRDLFDAVVIIRGGGATSDLSGFEKYPLAAACAQFPLPIITGIGHERDDTVIDIVAHMRVKTPTAAAQLLIDHQTEQLTMLEDAAMSIKENIIERMNTESERLNVLAERSLRVIPLRVEKELLKVDAVCQRLQSGMNAVISNEKYGVDTLLNRIMYAMKQVFVVEQSKLQLISQRIDDNSPQKVLSKGYSITYANGKAVKDASAVKPDSELQTVVSKGSIYSKVIKK